MSFTWFRNRKHTNSAAEALITMRPVLLLIIFYVFLPDHASGLNGGDTLVFVRGKKPSAEFRLPLNAYPVYIKMQKQRKIYCIISSRTDTTLVIREFHTNKKVRKRKRAVMDSLWHKYDEKSWSKENTMRQMAVTDSLLNLLDFSVKEELNIRSIRYIKIYNGYRPEKKKLIAFSEMNSAAALTAFFILPVLTLVNPVFVVLVYIAAGYLLLSGIFSLIVENKKIDLKRKWKIKK
jgi:hypothetical protein